MCISLVDQKLETALQVSYRSDSRLLDDIERRVDSPT